MRRRDFLAIAGVGGLATFIGSSAYRVTQWWHQPTAASRNVLSETEASITGAILDAMFPGDSDAYAAENRLPNGRDTDALEYFDWYLDRLDRRSANLIRLLLHAIDEIAFFRGLQFRRFRKRPRDQRVEILKNWDESSLGVRRSAFRAMKLALAGGYFNDPDVRRAIGIYHTCSTDGRDVTALRDESTP